MCGPVSAVLWHRQVNRTATFQKTYSLLLKAYSFTRYERQATKYESIRSDRLRILFFFLASFFHEVRTTRYDIRDTIYDSWLGREDSNPRITDPKSAVLPLHHAPSISYIVSRIAYSLSLIYSVKNSDSYNLQLKTIRYPLYLKVFSRYTNLNTRLRFYHKIDLCQLFSFCNNDTAHFCALNLA